MKPLFSTFSLALAALLLPFAARAQAQSGALLKTFPIKAGKLLLDPNRPRLYATMPLDDSLAVIDTNTNTVVTTFYIGSKPEDLAISPDGSRLYVANKGSMSAAIGVVDLTTLTTLPSLSAPFEPVAIAAGLDNRLYLLPLNFYYLGAYAIPSIAQIDAISGSLETSFGDYALYNGYLTITPDRKTLFYGNKGILPSTMAAFDVSTSTPGPQRNTPLETTGANGQGLTVSHNGSLLVYPNGTSNAILGGYVTFLFSAADISRKLGSFDTGAYPGIAVFSADDRALYQVQSQGYGLRNVFRIFDTSTFAELDAFADPDPNSAFGYPRAVTGLAITEPNGYLYIAEKDGTFENQTGYLEMVSTRRSPFFRESVALGSGYYYLKFSDGVPFGYYNFDYAPVFYHADLGFEYTFDAADGDDGIYLYDFKSKTFWFTSRKLFPYLYDFTLGTWLYYYPDPIREDHYNTNGVRYFFDFDTQKIIRK